MNQDFLFQESISILLFGNFMENIRFIKMSKIKIPQNFIEGFNIISLLKPKQVSETIKFINKISLSNEVEVDYEKLNDVTKQKNSKILVDTIFSFSELLEDENIDNKMLSIELAKSYSELKKIDSKRAENLQENLYEIFNSPNSLKMILKARTLSNNNENILLTYKIITDIRLIFNEEIANTDRSGLILHKLFLEYNKGLENKEIYLTLDLNDLKKLKLEIDKAITKEELIKKDYSNINFIIPR